MFGGAAGIGGAGRRTQFEAEDFGAAAPGRDVTGTVTITLPEVATGTSRRVLLPTGKEIDVKIRQASPMARPSAEGAGPPGPVGAAGDALIRDGSGRYSSDGANLWLEPHAYEAVLGGKVRAPTLDGRSSLPFRGTSSGRTFRVKGKGLPSKDGAGDLYATVRIVLPERADEELEALMRKWRDGKRFDPRRDMS
jgi:DnaJ-class molecular chaperone